MDEIARILVWFRTRADETGVLYAKARDISPDVGLKTREVAYRLQKIDECDSVPVRVTKWSTCSGAVTYRIEVEDRDALGAGDVETVAEAVH